LPELPEVEATARRLNEAVAGKTVDSVVAAGVSTLKSYDPPLDALRGVSIKGVGRRGKYLMVHFANELTLLMHLMSAGRFQLFDKQGSIRDRTSRLLIRLEGGSELRLREFGTKQSAWAKLMKTADLDTGEPIASLGPEAWPDPPPLLELLKSPRALHVLLRDQQVITGIGRSWVDEILHCARLSPFKRGDTLTEDEAEVLRDCVVATLQRVVDFYEGCVSIPIPDKFPMPLTVHRHNGEPCPRCGTQLEAVFYEDHIMCYCPQCQTGGKVLKDRRLSRLLK
jgi:formamidopyrimidine-DNA glycosylase